LITFSPLAAGLLSGKYQGDQVPDASRRSFVSNLGGRVTPRVFGAVDAYLAVAQKHCVDPIHMALAWCHTRPFMCSAIFGATNMKQLEHILDGADIVLSQECLDDLNAAHKAHPMPY
jgi:aryl-alcohol dehydrogenase-like predicted oxidoreductase